MLLYFIEIEMGSDSSEVSEDTTLSSQQSTDQDKIDLKRKRKKVIF